MVKLRISFMILMSFYFSNHIQSQVLQPGFDKEEYRELVYVFTTHYDREASMPELFQPPSEYFFDYCSYEICLKNKWDLWIGNDKDKAVLSIRGSTKSSESWLENFYAAMLPAKGELKIDKDYVFDYNLSDNPQAKVHVGWLIATGFMVREMQPRIDSCYKAGIKDFLIFGHSQGGAISYLVTAYFLQQQKLGNIPNDIQFKTYCSAAPKPGNLAFAYDYEYMTQGGWAFNVVNTADWVPETPFTVQTINDMNPVNPFTDAEVTIKKQKLKTRIALKYAYNKMVKPTYKAQKSYERFLGGRVSKFVQKNLPYYEPEEYSNSAHYSRAGNFIILKADDKYYEIFPDDKEKLFQHHFLEPYLFLLNQL